MWEHEDQQPKEAATGDDQQPQAGWGGKNPGRLKDEVKASATDKPKGPSGIDTPHGWGGEKP